MAFTPIERMQIKNAVERVLHVPGNYNGGILEMAMVFDGNLVGEVVKQLGKDITALLKSHSEIFRNVRLNGIRWMSDEEMINEVTSLPHLQMGRYFETYEHRNDEKHMEILAAYLKKFYARSKIIILFTDGNSRIEDLALYKESMHPFLYRKLIVVECCVENAVGTNREKDSVNESTEAVCWKLQVHSGVELLRLPKESITE